MDALTAVMTHQSIRRFTGESISEDNLNAVTAAIRRTSSSCFLQLVSVIRISDREKLRRLAELSGNQEHIAQCSHFFMFCIDLTKLMKFTDLKPPFSFRLLFMGLNDCSMACQNALTVAESLGLGGVAIGGFKKSMEEVTELLKLPVGTAPLLGLCLGVPDEKYREDQKPRLPVEWTIMDEEWHDAFNDEELKAYDEDMRDYYMNRRYNQRNEGWSSSCAAVLETQKNSDAVISLLKKQGFEFI